MPKAPKENTESKPEDTKVEDVPIPEGVDLFALRVAKLREERGDTEGKLSLEDLGVL